MPKEKTNRPPKKIFTPLTVLCLVLFFLSSSNFLLYLLQYAEAKQLRGELEAERETNNKLSHTLEELTQELNQLQQKYAQLEEEKKEWGEKRAIGGSGPTAYLTFDDGPSENTLLVLEILKEYNVPATFFVTGTNISGDEHIYKRILSEGHALGNHTYSHNLNTIYRSVDVFLEDLLQMEQIIFEQTELKPDIIRFPGGSSNTVASSSVMRELISTLTERGYDYFDWNISPEDSAGGVVSAETVINNMDRGIRKHAGRDIVVLLHDHYSSHYTVQALPRIIEMLSDQGYQFASLQKGTINMKHR